MILLLLGCEAGGLDSSGTTKTTESRTTCPALDCRDTLTLTVLGTDGSPEAAFYGSLTPEGGERFAFSCGTNPEPVGVCDGAGAIQLFTYAASYEGRIDIGDDAPCWTGTLTPTWDAPYDSPECGHYCWIAAEVVTLEDCGGG